MGFLYSILGVVAKISSSMSRYRVNLVPSNWLVIGLCVLFAWVAISDRTAGSGGMLLGLGCLLIGGTFLLSSLMQHTIFQRTSGAAKAPSSTPPAMQAATQDASPFSSHEIAPSVASAPAENARADIRLTGRLRLHEKLAQRFIDVPVSPVHLEDGAFAFASNIDASSRMYGVVTQKRSGLWLTMPQPRTLSWEEGLLYNGFKPRPALRLRYADALEKDKKSSAILSFGSAAQRAQTVANLQKEVERAGA